MAESGESLEAQGLICHSYDSLFAIRKRLRKISDVQIPLKRGLATNQIGMFLVAFIICMVTYGLIIVPLMSLFGIERSWQILVVWLFVPPFLAAQRIAKPMAYGKSIGGAVKSMMRYALDDRTHRRGTPIPPRKRPAEEPVAHWQREWVVADPIAAEMPGLEQWTDPQTEARLSGDVVVLQHWMDQRATHLIAEEEAERERSKQSDEITVHYKRGRATSVVIPDEEKEQV